MASVNFDRFDNFHALKLSKKEIQKLTRDCCPTRNRIIERYFCAICENEFR